MDSQKNKINKINKINRINRYRKKDRNLNKNENQKKNCKKDIKSLEDVSKDKSKDELNYENKCRECRDCVVYEDKNKDQLNNSDKKYPSIFFSSLYSKSLKEREREKEKDKDKIIFPKQDPPKLSFSNEFSSLLKLLEISSREKEKNNESNKEKIFNCKNILCDHNDKTIIEPLNITEIKNIDKLLELAKTFHCKSNKMFYNINLRVLHKLIDSLNDINKIIGMKNVKDKLVDQILYFLQGYHNKGKKCLECIDCELGITCMKNQSDMLHTVITGPPGVGKTMLAKHLAVLYNKIGILKTDKFKIVSRSDLVGKYLGETAIKTQAVIDEADGGVLFIDEAYSLGYTGERDFYSKECIDTLTKNLSEKKTFICIIAGYKDSLDKCFFSHNEGLSRRFTFRYDLDKYSWKELKEIFEIKVKQENFSVGYDDEINQIFKDNEKYFINNGGDMETLYLKTKLAHCRNIIIKPEEQFVLNTDDVKKGIQDLIETRQNKKDDNIHHMYI
jgi:SpoVK/Ycf46/Vps4 family AAA+-type ATPase